MFFFKPVLLRGNAVKPGFNLPRDMEDFFWPDQEFDVHKALDHFKEAVNYYNTNGPLAKHPVFGKLAPGQNLNLNCQHCAMHLSFVHPD